MLKYCEAYRTMRDSLCREQSREHYNRGETDRRTAKGVESPRRLPAGTKDCVYKDETLKCEEPEGLEKQNRRQSVNFDKEFTFSPRLNLTSLRIAKDRSGRAQEAIQRRANALVAETQQNFTFKPNMSSKSEKIAQSLKTSFLERQLIHVEKQRKKMDSGELVQPSQQGPRLSFVFRPTRHTKQLDFQKPDQDYISTAKYKELKNRHLKTMIEQETKEFTQNSPYNVSVENMAIKRSRQNMMRYKRLKTHPLANCESVAFEDETKENVHHKRSFSHDVKHQYHNMSLLNNKLRQSKLTAENAIKERKIFVCHGPYPIVRASLRKRGWIEKHFKGCAAAAATKNNKKSSNSNQQDNQENENSQEETKLTSHNNKELVLNRNNGEDNFDDDDDDENTKWQAGYEGEDCEYSLLSRFCRNATASFFWTCRRDDIDFKYLRKDQMANHFSKAYSFTTKVGLCSHLRDLSWFENAKSDTFFPRCHRLGCDGEKEDFIDDYRITSACNILKLVTKPPNKTMVTIITPTVSSPTTIVKSKSMFSVRSDSTNNDGHSPSPTDTTQPKPQRSRSSVGVRKDLIGQDKSRVVKLALRACQEFIMGKTNEDIDKSQNESMTEEHWEELVEYYYQIVHNNFKLELTQELLEQCRETLQEIRQYLPQFDLDGVRNVWIVKPGAKSRGRGITCMDRLEDILKLVSSSVKKENRWIVQKYIEWPLLVYNTKFDIRQWFLVTDWNPLTLWFYKDCYFRFCSQEFTLDNFEPCIHLANNSIQKHYQNGVRDKRLPENNMWSSEDFQEYLSEKGKGHLWDKVIYPGMRQAIIYTLECCQITLEARKNSFELYGADFMLTEDYKPWLIEVNSSPAMSASTHITRKLCANVIEDTMKVVLDRREDKHCDTGRFELAFKQSYVDAPPYIGINLVVNGKGILNRAFSPFRRQLSNNRLQQIVRPKDKAAKTTQTEPRDNADEEETKENNEKTDVRETTVLKLKETSLVLHCGKNNELASNKVSKQTRCVGKALSSTFEAVRRRKSDLFDNSDKNQGIKGTQIKTLNIDPNIKLVPKKNSANKLTISTYRTKVEQKVGEATKVEVESKVSSRIIAIPDNVGVQKTILRYTDKRLRQTKTVPINMDSSFKLRKDVEIVK